MVMIKSKSEPVTNVNSNCTLNVKIGFHLLVLLVLILQASQGVFAKHAHKNQVGFYSQDERERKREQAKKIIQEGDQLFSQRTEEFLRQALAKYESALVVFREIDDKQNQADALKKISGVYGALGEYKKALQHLETALPLSRQGDNQILQAEILSNIAVFHSELGEYNKATPFFEQALTILESIGDQRRLATLLSNYGANWSYSGDKQKAIENFQRALQLRRAVGDKEGEAYTLNNIGDTYNEMGEKRRAIDFFQQSSSILKTINNPRLEGIVYNNLASSHQDLGEFQLALEFYQQAVSFSDKAGDKRGKTIGQINIATLYDELGETEQAVTYLQDALKTARELKDNNIEAHILYSLGATFLKSDQPQKALEYFTKAREIWLRQDNQTMAVWSLRGLGGAYRKLGDYTKALDFYQQALSKIRATKMRSDEAEVLSYLGNVYEAMGLVQQTNDTYTQAVNISREIEYRDQEAEALFFLARFEMNRNNLEAAREYIEGSIEIIESLRANPSSNDLRASFMALKQDYYDLQIDVLMRLQQRSSRTKEFAEQAFRVSERARARGLLETLAEARADIRQGVSSALLEKEFNLQKAINAKAASRQTLRGEKDKEQAARLDKEISELRSQLSEVRGKIRDESPNYAVLTQIVPLTLSEIQKLLDDETMLLEYKLGENRSLLWVATSNSFDYYELPKREAIESKARRVYELLSSQNKTATSDAELAKATGELSQMILAPASKSLTKKRIIIIADGMLNYLPFAMLSNPQSAIRNLQSAIPLIEYHEIIYLPSASVLSLLRRDLNKRDATEKTVAVFADPVFNLNDPRFVEQNASAKTKSSQSTKPLTKDGSLERSVRDAGITSFQRLRFTRDEATMISSLLTSGQGMSALDFKANRAMATSDELKKYRIIHFATHGLLNSNHPELSGLVFSLFDEKGQPQEGFLRLHEIYNLKLNADLVVLSACQTALGKNVKGEGLIGLTRGFMYAGAPRVVASLWQVDDRATAELMKRFYKAMLKDGMKPAAALRVAQVSMLQEERWNSPRYWAAFVLQGEWK
jgi:CHAT domain-containing protein